MHHTDKYSQHRSNIWPVLLNGWVSVCLVSGRGFESRNRHLNFRYRAFRYPATLLKRVSNTGVPCEYCENFKYTYLEEQLRTVASEIKLNMISDKSNFGFSVARVFLSSSQFSSQLLDAVRKTSFIILKLLKLNQQNI